MSSKTVLITGGARGIGEACCRLFAARGWNVAINYNASEPQARALMKQLCASGCDCEIFHADVSASSQVGALFDNVKKRFGTLHALVCNSGVAGQALLQDIGDETWQRLLAVNTGGAFYCCREASRGMIAQQYGKIVLISSIWGECGGALEAHYSASKAALHGLTKALAKELGPSGVNVNCVSPGVILTDMCAHFDEKTLAGLAEETAVGRLGTPEDVAHAVCFLCSDDASFITGQVLSVNGGAYM